MKNQKFVRAIALALVVSMANIFVLAVPGAGDIPVPASSVQDSPVGVLSGKKSKSVMVNGNPALDGMTINSGSEIKTDKSGAIVNIRGVGSVELCTETTVKLNYTKDRVELTVIGGSASLTTMKGVTGDLITPEGLTFKTDPSLDTSTIQMGCAWRTGAAVTGFEGLPFWVLGVVAAVGAVAAIIAIAGNDDRATVSAVSP